MNSKPTQQQIKTATKLQELGICQGAKLWILKVRTGYVITESFKNKPFTAANIGPLPTAAECWIEIKELLDKHDFRISILSHYANCHKNEDEEDVIFETDEYIEDLDEFYRQTLISLAEMEK